MNVLKPRALLYTLVLQWSPAADWCGPWVTRYQAVEKKRLSFTFVFCFTNLILKGVLFYKTTTFSLPHPCMTLDAHQVAYYICSRLKADVPTV